MLGSKARGAGDGKVLGNALGNALGKAPGNVCKGAPYSNIDCIGEATRKFGSGRVRKPI